MKQEDREDVLDTDDYYFKEESAQKRCDELNCA